MRESERPASAWSRRAPLYSTETFASHDGEDTLPALRKLDVRLPGTEKSNSHGARPVHSNHLDDEVDSDRGLSIHNSSLLPGSGFGVWKGGAANEVSSYVRRIDSCITQLMAQGPSRTCNESKEDEEGPGFGVWGRGDVEPSQNRQSSHGQVLIRCRGCGV